MYASSAGSFNENDRSEWKQTGAPAAAKAAASEKRRGDLHGNLLNKQAFAFDIGALRRGPQPSNKVTPAPGFPRRIETGRPLPNDRSEVVQDEFLPRTGKRSGALKNEKPRRTRTSPVNKPSWLGVLAG
jgi:hypothetical protein